MHVVAGTALLSSTPMAASPTTAGAMTGAAALEASTSAKGGGGHQHVGGHDSNYFDLTSDDVVAFSSRLVAAVRAVESRRTDRLYNDPFAELLAGHDAMQAYDTDPKVTDGTASAPDAFSSTGSGAATAAGGPVWCAGDTGRSAPKRLAIRTRFYDDFFEDCAGPKAIKQIVLLGAGMDARGLRLKATPGTKVFEVDQALVLRVKSALLSKALADGAKEKCDGVGQARVTAVEADLSQAGWVNELLEAGFDPSQPSAWILEGLTMYLDEQELVSLIHTLAELCSAKSAFCASSFSEDAVGKAQVSGRELFSTWKWGSDKPQVFFKANFPDGWVFKEVTCGTPGMFPDGADYGLGFKAKDPTFVVGYFTTALEGGCKATDST